MEIYRAGTEDAELLVGARLDFLRNFRTIEEETEAKLAAALKSYYTEHVPNGGLVALLGKEDGQVVGTAMAEMIERLPTDRLLSGKCARVTSVYTYPGHRGQGHGRMLLEELLRIIKEQGAELVELNASDEGMALYRHLGFQLADGTQMWKRL